MNAGKRSATAFKNGALVSASFGPPPMCRPMFSTLSSGSGRSGCFGSSTISGRRRAGTAGVAAAAGAPAAAPGDCAGDGVPVRVESVPAPGTCEPGVACVVSAQPATLQIAKAQASRKRAAAIGLLTQERITRVIADKTILRLESIWFEPADGMWQKWRHAASLRLAACARFARFARVSPRARYCSGVPLGRLACDERGKQHRRQPAAKALPPPPTCQCQPSRSAAAQPRARLRQRS